MKPRGTTWRKSSYSGGAQASDCVEVAQLADVVGIRDSKDRKWGHVEARRDAWKDLVSALKR